MMNENIPDPFELIRREAEPAEPSEEDVHRARQRLQATILGEQKRASPVRRWLVPALVTAILLALVGGVAIFRSAPAEAALAEVAVAAGAASPLDIPQGSFVYTRSERVDLAIRPGAEFGLDHEFIAYLLPATREVWRQPETEFIQIRTANHNPTFFDPAAEDAYYRLGLDATDRIDQTQTEQLTDVTDPLLEEDWPTQPDALHEALRDYASQGGDERPEDIQVFDLATDLLRETDPIPQLRAAVIEVLAELPIELEEQSSQTITIGITYTTPIPTKDTITLSTKGQLLAETRTLLEGDPELGIPADTIVLKVDYLKTGVTDDL
ncbi:MAG: hypothetical protein ACRDWS_03275 [Acidimicrobiia bacterium]